MGLTTGQVDVAMMLTDRMSNREIAGVLQISPHTARHHTERVLMKLRLSARHEIAEVWRPGSGAAGQPPEEGLARPGRISLGYQRGLAGRGSILDARRAAGDG